MEAKQVTITTIVNGIQEEIDLVKADKKLDTEKRSKILGLYYGRQLQAGALTINFKRSVGRLAEGSANAVLQLNAPPEADPLQADVPPTKQ